MADNIFLFDLDSTITKVEILPEISKFIGVEEKIKKLTEDTMQGNIPFKHSFLKRVEILGKIDVDIVSDMVGNLPLNENIVKFLEANRESCYIITGNLDVWIYKLLDRMGMRDHCYCSKALVADKQIKKVISVLDKGRQVEQMVQPFISIGDGDNDSAMAEKAKIAIGFGGVREIAPSLMRTIDYAFYNEITLYNFLNSIL